VDERELLAERFEGNRTDLPAVAYRHACAPAPKLWFCCCISERVRCGPARR